LIRDLELIRDLLLGVEKAVNKASWKDFVTGMDESAAQRILKHLELMEEDGLIKSMPIHIHRHRLPVGIELTSRGHDFVHPVHERGMSSAVPQSSAGDAKLEKGDNMSFPDPRRVFIVYGRNTKAYDAMRLFLQSLKLDPLTFDEVRNTLRGSPFVGDVVRAGLERAQGIIVLFTPDEYACLRPSLSSAHDAENDLERWQPRPNVILEAGMALAISEQRTILVLLGKGVVLASDLLGRHYINVDNDPKSRARLRDALAGIGCSIDHIVTH